MPFSSALYQAGGPTLGCFFDHSVHCFVSPSSRKPNLMLPAIEGDMRLLTYKKGAANCLTS